MATESEYSEITDLAAIRAAKSVLRDIMPDCCHDAIPKEEWQSVMQTLMKWEAKLTDNIQVY